jgi:hypothetical protein
MIEILLAVSLNELRDDPALIDAVARCMAKDDGKLVSATEWAGAVGSDYRRRAGSVIHTISNYQAGIRSGGLPGG